MDQLDAQTKYMLYHSNGRLRSLGYPEIDLEKRGYFAVGGNQASRRYYAYLRSRFGPTAGLYFFQDGEMLTSNCDLLDLKLSILMGIDNADIDGKTQAFFDYLTLIYMFDQASQSGS